MTETEFNDAFSRFMTPRCSRLLAAALCRQAPEASVIDDMAGALQPDDGNRFGDDGRFLPGTARTAAEEHVHEEYYGDDVLVALPAAAVHHAWMQDMVGALVPADRFRFYALDDSAGAWRGIQETALAICAIRKAFPGSCIGLIRSHVEQNWLYAPSWHETVTMFGGLLPDGYGAAQEGGA